MQIFEARHQPEVIIIVLAILGAFMAWQLLNAPRVAMVVLCGVAIGGPLHAVRLYSQNDSMMGGLPQANYGYNLGFIILAAGNIIACYGFLIEDASIVYFGSFFLLGGIGTLVGASTLLFKHIIRRGLRSNQI